MKKMKKQFIKLLNIHGVSGDEGRVRSYLKPILTEMMDVVEVDNYGNLLGTKKIGSGEGATILLSAHMDTVRNVYADRNLIEQDGVITSSKGALGADDRAGIAIIMEVLRNVEMLAFEGTVKVAFSREEEIGCVGSGKIDPKWYEDVDLAIVADRRGSRDIVVGCGNAFCSDAVGNFFEEVSKMQGMDWRATEGGISDACTFSTNGINSVNLSVGYSNEHTDKEFVIFDNMKDTVRLILQAFAVVNTFCHTFGEVPDNNKWVLPYTKYGKYSSYGNYDKYSDKYFEDTFYNTTEIFEDDIYAETFDTHNGDTFIYEIGKNVVIQQGENEVILTRENLKELLSQLKGVLN